MGELCAPTPNTYDFINWVGKWFVIEMGSVFVDLLGAGFLYGACERIFLPIYTSSYYTSMLVRKGDDSLAFKVFVLRVERASTLFVHVYSENKVR